MKLIWSLDARCCFSLSACLSSAHSSWSGSTPETVWFEIELQNCRRGKSSSKTRDRSNTRMIFRLCQAFLKRDSLSLSSEFSTTIRAIFNHSKGTNFHWTALLSFSLFLVESLVEKPNLKLTIFIHITQVMIYSLSHSFLPTITMFLRREPQLLYIFEVE